MRSYLFIPLILVSIFLFDSCKKEALEEDTNNINNPIDATDTINTTDTTGIIDTTDTTTLTPLPCNGYLSLCDKQYDEMTFVMPHNAHAYTPVYSTLAANQERDIATQLMDGVRAFTFKTYTTSDAACGPQGVYVYHGFPALGCMLFSEVLQPIKNFMEANPREVITLGIEGSSPIADMKQVLDNMGLSAYLHVQTFGQPWPTLQEMITSGKRLVIFAARGNANNFPGYHDYWNYIVDNDYEARRLSDFDCEWFRGNPSGDFYLFNHFLTNLSPQRDSAAVINTYAKLKGRIDECVAYHGRTPNFLHVDFYNLGDCLRIADELNGVQ